MAGRRARRANRYRSFEVRLYISDRRDVNFPSRSTAPPAPDGPAWPGIRTFAWPGIRTFAWPGIRTFAWEGTPCSTYPEVTTTNDRLFTILLFHLL